MPPWAGALAGRLQTPPRALLPLAQCPQRWGRRLSPLPGRCRRVAPAGRGLAPRGGSGRRQQTFTCSLSPGAGLVTASAGPAVSRGTRVAERLTAAPGPAVTPVRPPLVVHVCVCSGIFTEGPLRAGLGATAACDHRPGAVGSAPKRFLPEDAPVRSPRTALCCRIECCKPRPRAHAWQGDPSQIREGFLEEVPVYLCIYSFNNY